MQTKKDIDKLCKHLQKSTTLFWEFPIAQITQGMECPVISCDNKTAFRKVKGKCVNKVPKCRTSFSERTFYCCEKCGALFMLEQDFIQMKEKERNNQFRPFTVNGCRNPQDIVHRATRCHFSDKFTPPSKEFFISMQYEEKPSSLCLTDDYYRFLYPESDEEGFELKEALTSSGASYPINNHLNIYYWINNALILKQKPQALGNAL